MPMFGAHLSIAGGLHHALVAAQGFGMDCVQIFTRNQQQWKAAPLREEEIALWRQHRRATGLSEVVCHDSYLINLASPSAAGWRRSMAAFRAELLRCEALGIRWVVTHPGAHMGAGEEKGLARVAAALDELHRDLPGLKAVTCLEVTAGQGTSLGYRFEQLRRILDAVREPERVAVCLDTAHLLAAGYDLTSAKGAQAVLAEFDAVVGLERVRVMHVNDSKTPRGSRVDRHAHLGAGHVALSALRVIVRDRRLRKVPKILETPKEGKGPGGRDWDAVNLERLRRL